MPSRSVPGFLKLMFDGFIHSGIYAALSVLLFFAIAQYKIQGMAWVIALRIFVSCATLGLILEFMQELFVVGRTFEISDVLANIIGAAIVLLLNFILIKRDAHKMKSVA